MAKATISYAAGELAKRISPGTIAVELFMPMNLVVMFFIFCLHVFSGMMFIVMFMALFFLVPPFLVIQGLILAHYGNVIDESHLLGILAQCRTLGLVVVSAHQVSSARSAT